MDPCAPALYCLVGQQTSEDRLVSARRIVYSYDVTYHTTVRTSPERRQKHDPCVPVSLVRTYIDRYNGRRAIYS
jgi:hypothetical protein